MIGGGLKIQNILKESKISNVLSLSILVIVILLIRAYIVKVTYNLMWPKMIKNTGGDNSKFKSLTFYESIMIVLLFDFLFRM